MRIATLPRRPQPRFLILGLALAACLAAAVPAAAQGTSGAFPDPISTRELEGYCDRLNMSDQQRQGIGLYHDEYLESFRGLREGPIEEFLQEHGSRVGFALATRTDRKTVEQSVRKRDDLMNRIATLDNRLFDRVQNVLSESQVASLPRVRQARERTRYRAGIARMAMFSGPGARVDLSEIVAGVDLGPETMEVVDPVVAQYERSLTAELRRLYEGASTIQLDLQDRMSDLGFGEGRPPRNREDREAFAQAIQSAFQELNDRLGELSSDVSELNKRTATQIARIIPEAKARELKMRYYDQAYPGVPVGRGEAGRRFNEIERISDVTDAQKAQISQIEHQFLRSLDGLVEQMVAVIEDRPSRGFEFRFRGGDREPDESQQKMERLRDQRDTLIERTVDEINLVLGEDLARRLDERIARGEEDEEGVVQANVIMTAIDGPGGGGIQTFTIQSSGNLTALTEPEDEEQLDTYVPGPISKRDLDRYAAYLGLSDDMQPILSALLEDYNDRFDVLRDTRIKAVKEKSRSLWAIDEETGAVASPDRSDIEQLYALRRSALNEIRALDDAFFTDLQTVLPDGDHAIAMKRIRLARQRDIYSRGRDTGGFRMFGPRGGRGGRSLAFIGGGPGNSSEALVDLTDIAEEVELGESERRAIDPVLAKYETGVTAHFQTAFETSMKFNEIMDAIQAQAMNVSEDGDRVEMNIGGGEMREVMQNEGRIQRETRRDIIEMNRATLDDLVAALPDDAGRRLRDLYNRSSFPGIYNDPRSVEPVITAAYNQVDLAPQQRLQLDDIAAEYRSTYEDLSQQMVELRLQEPIDGPFGGGRRGGRGRGGVDFQAMQQQQREMEKLRFDRRDLCDKTRGRIKALLTEDQQARLGDLLDPPDTPDGDFIRIGG